MGRWPLEHPLLLCSSCSPSSGLSHHLHLISTPPIFLLSDIATQGPTVCFAFSLGYEDAAFYPGPSFIHQQSRSNCSGGWTSLPPCLRAPHLLKAAWPKERMTFLDRDELCPYKEPTGLSNSPPSSCYCAFCTTKFSLSDPDSLTLLVNFNRSSKLFQANQLMGEKPWRI